MVKRRNGQKPHLEALQNGGHIHLYVGNCHLDIALRAACDVHILSPKCPRGPSNAERVAQVEADAALKQDQQAARDSKYAARKARQK